MKTDNQPDISNELIDTKSFIHREFCRLSVKMDRMETMLGNIYQHLSQDHAMPLPEIFTIKEAAAYLRLSVKRMYELLYGGRIQSLPHKKHHRLLFSKTQLNQYIYETNERR